MKKYGKYSLNTFVNRWGTWANFLNLVGDEPNQQRNVTDEELIDNYKRIKDELGAIPNQQQLTKLGRISFSQYYKRFGGHKNFLKYIGEKTAQEQLVEEYIKVKETLGKQPTAWEFSEHGNATWNTVSNYFGSWNKFLIAVGEKTLTGRRKSRLNKRNISKQDLMDAYFRLKESLGRQPDSSDMRDHGEFSLTSYVNHYGSWNNFLNEISEPILKEVKPVTKAELIATYYELKEKLGRIPKGVDMDNHGKYSAGVYFKKFGGWNNFLESIGEKSIKNQEELR